MKAILTFLFMAMLLSGAMATDTALTAAATLTSENSYATGAYWSSAPTSTNTKYIAAANGYDFIVAINATSVGTSPKLNIWAGNNPPAFRSSLGNYSLSLTANRTVWFGPLESARFINSTGYYKFSTTNVTTATMIVLKVKR
jgi:hypothetical protein